MYVEVKALYAGGACNGEYETMAIDDRLIDVVRPGSTPDKTCEVWDIDNCRVLMVKMPYRQFVALLNGEPYELPKEPEVVEVERWGTVNMDGSFHSTFGTIQGAQLDADRNRRRVVRLTGTYTK